MKQLEKEIIIATISKCKERGKYKLRVEQKSHLAVAEYTDTDLETVFAIIKARVMELKWESFHQKEDD